MFERLAPTATRDHHLGLVRILWYPTDDDRDTTASSVMAVERRRDFEIQDAQTHSGLGTRFKNGGDDGRCF